MSKIPDCFTAFTMTDSEVVEDSGLLHCVRNDGLEDLSKILDCFTAFAMTNSEGLSARHCELANNPEIVDLSIIPDCSQAHNDGLGVNIS